MMDMKRGGWCRLAVWTLLGITLLTTGTRAQKVTVSGTVSDSETGESLPYASIVVESTTQGAATNLDGHFVLLGVQRDSLSLVVHFLGYDMGHVKLGPDDLDNPVKIELEPATTELGDILVTADSYKMMKTAESISQVTVSPKDLVLLPNVGEADIFRSLQLLPGISGTNEGTSGLYIRGGTPDQNLVLLDGMTVYHVDHFFGFFSAFNADAIKDVQVFKGGFPANYGGRTASVVDLTGKSGSTNDFNLGIGANLLSASMLMEAPIGNRGSFLVSARRSYTDVLRSGLYNSIFDTFVDDGTEEGTQMVAGEGALGGGMRGGGMAGGFRGAQQAVVQPDFFFYDLNAKLTYRPTDKDVLAVSFYNGKDNLDQSRDTVREITRGDNATGAQMSTDIDDLTDWGNIGSSLKWSRQWTPRFYTNALASYSEYFSDYDRLFTTERLDAEADTMSFSRTMSQNENNNVGDMTLRLDNEFQVTSSNKVAFGVQLTQSDVVYDYVRDDTVNILSSEQDARQLAAYVQDKWTPFPMLELTAGLRIANYDVTGETYLEPRASAALRLTDRITLKAAYGEYNQFVARVVNESVTEGARDFWLLADGETVGVQNSRHYIVGASYDAPQWLFDVEAYHKELSGLSEFSLRFQRSGVDLVADDLFYGGEGVARGLEVLLQKKTGRHTGWLSYTLSEVEHTFPELNDGEPFPALHDQTHELKIVNSFQITPRLSFASTWTYATGKPYTSPESEYAITLLDGTQMSYIHVGEKNGERLPAYHRFDAAVHYRFPMGSAETDIGFSVFNLYGRENIWYREFDLSETPILVTDVTFLGLTPNFSIRVDF